MEKVNFESPHKQNVQKPFFLHATVAKGKSGGVHVAAHKELLCEHLGKVAGKAEVVHKSAKGLNLDIESDFK